MRVTVYSVLDRLGAVLLPPRCLLCHGPGASRARDLCADCEADLPRNRDACPRCGLPMPPGLSGAAVLACPQCRGRRLPYRRCHATFLYEFPLTDLLPVLKYHGALAHARVLGTLLGESVAGAGLQCGVELLLPMPLHRSRLVERGYNQSLELARHAGAVLRVELAPQALQRTRATAPQVGLSRAERSANVREAFRATDPARVAGRTVALLDDVVTTGATVAAAADALLVAGARDVDVWCVARAIG